MSTSPPRRLRALVAYGGLLALTLACGAGASEEPPPAPTTPAPTAPAPAPVPPAPVPPAPPGTAAGQGSPIVFDGMTYQLAGSELGRDGALREYLPAGQTFETFTHMVAVRDRPGEQDPLAFANRFVATLRAQTPPPAFHLARDDRGRAFLDFTTRAGPISEFNIFVYERDPSGAGLRSHQIVRRSYQNPDAFRLAMVEERPRLLRLAADYTFPAPR